MRKITCPCEQVFKAEIPETVNLDKEKEALDKIVKGTILSCICPACNAVLNLDLPLTVSWPSRKTTIHMVPEIERLSLVSGNTAMKKNTEYVVGYAELVDRVSVLRDNLEPVVVEAIKLRLLEKARESAASGTPVILYEKNTPDNELEFHIHGIRENEIAVTRIPRHLYDSVLEHYRSNPEQEDYTALRNGGYLSVRNILLEETPDA